MNYYTGKHVNLNLYRRKNDFLARALAFCKKPVAMICATVIICGSILGVTFKKAFSYKHVELGDLSNSELGITAELPKGIVNIALFGIDSRNYSGFSGNSDSIMILSINTDKKTVKLTSIMRDSVVNIEGYRTTKINAAYARGGAALAIKTINQNFNMNITEYATVNFTGMAEIIDAIGGVTVNLSQKEVENANTHIKWLTHVQGTTPHYIEKAGEQRLDGMQAVAFSRIRYFKFGETGNTDDFGRTDRQRYVMEQLLNSVLNLKPTQYPGLIKTCLPFVETSLSYKEILSFAGLLTSDLKFEQSRVPDAKYVINAGFRLPNGGSSVYYNLDYATKVLHAFIYDDMDAKTYMDTYGIDKTPWYQSGGFSTGAHSKPETTGNSSKKQNASGVSSSHHTSSDVSSGETVPSSSEVIPSSEPASSDESSGNATSSGETVPSKPDVSSNPAGPADPSSSKPAVPSGPPVSSDHSDTSDPA